MSVAEAMMIVTRTLQIEKTGIISILTGNSVFINRLQQLLTDVVGGSDIQGCREPSSF